MFICIQCMCKTNAADVATGKWCIRNFNHCYLDKIYCHSTNVVKNWKWRNKRSIELYCLFIAADSIVEALNFSRRIVLWFQNKFSRNLAPGRFEFLNPATSGYGQIWNTWIKSDTTLMCTTFWCNNIMNAWINDVSECDNCDNFVITDGHFICDPETSSP